MRAGDREILALRHFEELSNSEAAEALEPIIAEAVDRASLTLQGVTSFEVERIEGLVDNGEITYKVLDRISFEIKERVHE